MFLYWASKGLLEICERGKRVGMKQIGKLPEDAPEHASFLFDRLFRKSDTVWLDHLPEAVTDHKGELRDKVAERFTGKNAVVQDDTMYATMTAMALLIVSVFIIEVTVTAGAIFPALLAMALFCALALLQNGALGFRSKHDTFEVVTGSVGTAVILILHLILLRNEGASFLILFTVCFLICIPCIMFMERRVNHRLYGQILGFRQYIETAEWDRLKKLSEEDPNYGMDILPYAMLFCMGTKWTAQFENDTIYSCVEAMEELVSDDESKK